jgi:uncharacterized protein (TIGR03083 family)
MGMTKGEPVNLEAVAADELSELDPFVLMADEARRIDAFASTLDDTGWRSPTGCDGWDRHDLLAHLAGSEQYNHACIDDAIGELMTELSAAGVSDVSSFNQWTVAARRGAPHDRVLDEWRAGAARTLTEFEARDGDEIPTMVGPYPARWQAFHLAAELATHADDLGVPVAEAERSGRLAWRARATRFFLAESRPELEVTSTGGGTLVRVGDLKATLDERTLVAAANGRPVDPERLAPSVREAMVLMP